MVSINHSRKVSDEVLGIWQRILIDNPSSSLIIVTMEKTPEGAQALFQSRFEKFGMPMSRILAAPRLSMLEFMRLSSIADFSLDSFPISGGVTTFHALWMGLPILTIKPQQPIPLQAYTSNILQTVGLSECIATDEASYLSIASKWINHPLEIELIRKKCRSQLLMSPYMAIQERVTELENTFEKMWIEFKK
jgi:predicted O-linked N-acetylglucosamine transferase (SPINDLY family)